MMRTLLQKAKPGIRVLKSPAFLNPTTSAHNKRKSNKQTMMEAVDARQLAAETISVLSNGGINYELRYRICMALACIIGFAFSILVCCGIITKRKNEQPYSYAEEVLVSSGCANHTLFGLLIMVGAGAALLVLGSYNMALSHQDVSGQDKAAALASIIFGAAAIACIYPCIAVVLTERLKDHRTNIILLAMYFLLIPGLVALAIANKHVSQHEQHDSAESDISNDIAYSMKLAGQVTTIAGASFVVLCVGISFVKSILSTPATLSQRRAVQDVPSPKARIEPRSKQVEKNPQLHQSDNCLFQDPNEQQMFEMNRASWISKRWLSSIYNTKSSSPKEVAPPPTGHQDLDVQFGNDQIEEKSMFTIDEEEREREGGRETRQGDLEEVDNSWYSTNLRDETVRDETERDIDSNLTDALG